LNLPSLRKTKTDRPAKASARRSQRSTLLALCLLVAAMFSSQAAFASNDVMTQAKFIFSLALHSEWPSSSFKSQDESINFCIIESEDVFSALNFIGIGKEIHGHPVNVTEIADQRGSDGCHVVFSSQTESGTLRRLSVALSGKSVLSVASDEKFADAGGIVGFGMIDGKIQFTINKTSTARSKIKISPKLLALGNVVR
jgi:hypothetical protein